MSRRRSTGISESPSLLSPLFTGCSLFRFIGLLPEGATLAIVVYGETAGLVLPPTTVTEEKREGLHGRVPRRVLEQTLR